MTLKHVIETVDINFLRHVLRKVTIIFQIKINDTSNYNQTFLRMLHATDFFAVIMILQNVIFVNNFVNLKKLKNLSFLIDKLLKLLNLNLKIFQRERFQFSKNSDKFLTMWTINDSYFLNLQIFFESILNEKNFDNYSEK